MFKITLPVIEESINRANLILAEVYPNYIIPKINNIKITNARSYWMNIGKIKSSHDAYGLNISKTFELIPNEQVAILRFQSSIIHELIHTQPRCMNHGKYFQKICYLVNKKYPQYKVKTSTSDEEVGLDLSVDKKPKYKIVCSKCGKEHYYFRKLIYNIEEYKCGRCQCDKLSLINL